LVSQEAPEDVSLLIADLDQARLAGAPMAPVNALEAADKEAAFGRAMVINARGELLAEAPHGAEQAIF
jgi:predicted amidohydrolase